MDPFGLLPPVIDPDELPDWILHDDDEVIVINKPGWFPCHPAKDGPYSSLLSAVQERFGFEKLHLVTRLDRETSGLVILAKSSDAASRFQRAIQERRVSKLYFAIVDGQLNEPIDIDQPIARRGCGPVFVKRIVSDTEKSQTARTRFEPHIVRNGFTICKVYPETGRTHQIRVHAEWMGHRIVGDKIYGPNETLFLDFIQKGWHEKLEPLLLMKRQALHCHQYTFNFQEGPPATFTAALPADFQSFCLQHMQLTRSELEALPLVGRH